MSFVCQINQMRDKENQMFVKEIFFAQAPKTYENWSCVVNKTEYMPLNH